MAVLGALAGPPLNLTWWKLRVCRANLLLLTSPFLSATVLPLLDLWVVTVRGASDLLRMARTCLCS